MACVGARNGSTDEYHGNKYIFESWYHHEAYTLRCLKALGLFQESKVAHAKRIAVLGI